MILEGIQSSRRAHIGLLLYVLLVIVLIKHVGAHFGVT